jgi:rubrerythrin
MSALYANAVSSIRMGVEDFVSQDGDRALSAVRNFYAGMLLLAKEALIRKVPEADPDEVIGTRYKPVPDGEGGVTYVVDGRQTIDFQTIHQRFKDFGLSIDREPLSELSRIRNDIEHRYTDQGHDVVREALAKAFPVAAHLFRIVGEDPMADLGESWQTMLETRAVYEQELNACRTTLEPVEWFAARLSSVGLRCTYCHSDLVEQLDDQNTDQESVELRCRACGEDLELSTIIEEAVARLCANEHYDRHKDAGEDGPVWTCPECGCDTYIDTDSVCANCGHELEGGDCYRCGNTLSMNDLIYGEGSGMCSYCQHMTEKIMAED